LEEVGSVRNQRFIRGNRAARNFVGSDRTETAEFVGVEQAGSGQVVRSAVSGLRGAADRSSSLNRPVPPTGPDQMYAPRLVVQFDHPPPASPQLRTGFAEQLAAIGSGIRVVMSGRTAILRGVVSSADDRALAAVLTSFEPGISAVENELRVAGDSAGPELPPLPPPPPPPGR
jgi:hypothetical protein